MGGAWRDRGKKEKLIDMDGQEYVGCKVEVEEGMGHKWSWMET